MKFGRLEGADLRRALSLLVICAAHCASMLARLAHHAALQPAKTRPYETIQTLSQTMQQHPRSNAMLRHALHVYSPSPGGPFTSSRS